MRAISLIAAGVILVGPAVAQPMPVFDAHIHYSDSAWGEVPVPAAIALLDRAGVRMALISSTPDAGNLRLIEAAPKRFVAILRPYRERGDMGTWHGDAGIVDYLKARLRPGVHRGIGEFHLSGEQARSGVVRQVLALAKANGLFVQAHADEAALLHLLDAEPGLRVLWAHAGFAEPGAVKAALAKSPNLWIELAHRADVADGGRLKPAWLAVIEAYPDRFLLGSDTYVVSRWQSLPDIWRETRAWLDKLPKPLAEGLAWRNAAKFLGLDEAVFTRP
jgi:Amidohydrolase